MALKKTSELNASTRATVMYSPHGEPSGLGLARLAWLRTCHASDVDITVTHETNRCCCVEVEVGALIYW